MKEFAQMKEGQKMPPVEHQKEAASRKSLLRIYRLLYGEYGPRNWWPADSPFEVIVGAILTQNTSWNNVEKAISNLKKNNVLDPEKLHKTPLAKLSELIKPAGYFKEKAKKIHFFLDYFGKKYKYSIDAMKEAPLKKVRKELLDVWGIGPETADSILLYALDKSVFVVDAYTLRIFGRLGYLNGKDDYDSTQDMFMKHLAQDATLFNEYHACIVAHGNSVCSPKPDCANCPICGKIYCDPHFTPKKSGKSKKK